VDTELRDSDIEAVEHNASVHVNSIWAARLWRHGYNSTSMTVTWERPHHLSPTNQLCAFKLHYYKANTAMTGCTAVVGRIPIEVVKYAAF